MSHLQWSAAGIALATMISLGAAVGWAQDKEAAVRDRQATMKIDTSEAEAMPGVLAVLTAADFPDVNASARLGELGEVNLGHLSTNVMARHKALYAGQKEGEQKLLEAIQKGDKAAVQAAIPNIGKNCSTCHGTYREKV